METLTYQDIIDDKIAEWQTSLKQIEEQVAKASSETQARLSTKVAQLKTAIDSAIVKLHDLDEHETVGNTMETKDKILEIFNFVDKDFQGFEDKTPFML